MCRAARTEALWRAAGKRACVGHTVETRAARQAARHDRLRADRRDASRSDTLRSAAKRGAVIDMLVPA